jgi:ribonucleotide monophosphatase NagD (HAD superfamily)
MVGDRLDTDISFRKVCDVNTALVLTGVTLSNEIKELEANNMGGAAEESLPPLTHPHVGLAACPGD